MTEKEVALSTENIAEVLENDLKEAARIKAEMDKLTPLKREYDEVRSRIDFAMHALKSERTRPVAGYFAVLQSRQSLQVVDEAAVIAWLEKNTFDPTQYMKIDPDLIKSLQDQKLTGPEADGELIPGIQVMISETVTLRRETKK